MTSSPVARGVKRILTSVVNFISRKKVRVGGAICKRTALGFIVKISRVRSVESRRSRSDIGCDNVCVDARLIEVEVVCWENRSLHWR